MRRNFTPDQALVDRLLLDDTNAFEELYRRHWYALYSYAFSKLKSHDDARKIVREVFVALWNTRNALPVNFSLPAFLYEEVRKSVVKCISNKMDVEANTEFVEKQIIPGFDTKELYKARKSVAHNNIYPKPGRLRLSEIHVAEKESWWEKYAFRTNFKGLKSAITTVFNF